MLYPSELVSKLLHQLKLAIIIATQIAVFLSLILYMFNIILTLFDYPKRYLQFNAQPPITIDKSLFFIGLVISQTIIGVFLQTLLFTLLLTPLFMPITYEILWMYRIALLTY